MDPLFALPLGFAMSNVFLEAAAPLVRNGSGAQLKGLFHTPPCSRELVLGDPLGKVQRLDSLDESMRRSVKALLWYAGYFRGAVVWNVR